MAKLNDDYVFNEDCLIVAKMRPAIFYDVKYNINNKNKDVYIDKNGGRENTKYCATDYEFKNLYKHENPNFRLIKFRNRNTGEEIVNGEYAKDNTTSNLEFDCIWEEVVPSISFDLYYERSSLGTSYDRGIYLRGLTVENTRLFDKRLKFTLKNVSTGETSFYYTIKKEDTTRPYSERFLIFDNSWLRNNEIHYVYINLEGNADNTQNTSFSNKWLYVRNWKFPELLK